MKTPPPLDLSRVKVLPLAQRQSLSAIETILVDPAMPPLNGAYVVIDYRGETTFRQFIVEEGRKFLKALNDAYPTVEMVENYSVRGVVVQRASRRRKDLKHYY